MLGIVLLVILILMLLGAVGTVPVWPHSRSWGYGPSGGLGLIVIVLLVLLFMGRGARHRRWEDYHSRHNRW